MVDTSIIMQAARTPSVDLPSILQRSAQSAAAIEQAPLLTRQQQVRTESAEQQHAANSQSRDRQESIRKSGIIYNYAKQLKSLPMAQRRTFLNTVPQDALTDLGIDPSRLQNMAIDDASIDTAIAQLEPVVMQGQNQQPAGARRSESLAGGRITMQELDDGTVRYLELGQEIPQDQIRDRVSAAQQEYIAEQRQVSGARRGGALDEEVTLKPQIAGAVASATSEAKGTESRAQSIIDSGVSASYSLPTMRRSLELLNTVQTGGFDNAALRVKQLFGIEGADEGELSGNLGKAVASQLKETFGAAFTNEERKSFERIEAGFGKNAEVNKRLLNNALKVAERKVNQAISRAEARGDSETVAELRDNMSYLLSEEDQPALDGGASNDEFAGFEIIE